MGKSKLTMAQQVAAAAIAFQRERTGHAPRAVTVVLSEDTLVVTLHKALTPAEEAVAKKSPAGRCTCRFILTRPGRRGTLPTWPPAKGGKKVECPLYARRKR